MRTQRRPRHYVSPGLLTLARPLFRYSLSRDAHVLRGVGRRYGPVLREDRRTMRSRRRFEGNERRRTSAA